MHARLKSEETLIPHLLVDDYVLRAEYLLLQAVNEREALVVVLVVQYLEGDSAAAAGVSWVFVRLVDNCAVLGLVKAVEVGFTVGPSGVRGVKDRHKVD
jgi:hypothetical protein